MGVDIAQYRARIGAFNKCYHVCHGTKVSYSSRSTTSVDVSDVILCMFGVIEFIRILLVIHGVEQNPGPTSPKGKKDEADGSHQSFHSGKPDMEIVEIIYDQQITSNTRTDQASVQRNTPENLHSVPAFTSQQLAEENPSTSHAQRNKSENQHSSRALTGQPSAEETPSSYVQRHKSDNLHSAPDLTGQPSAEETPMDVQEIETLDNIDRMPGMAQNDLVIKKSYKRQAEKYESDNEDIEEEINPDASTSPRRRKRNKTFSYRNTVSSQHDGAIGINVSDNSKAYIDSVGTKIVIDNSSTEVTNQSENSLKKNLQDLAQDMIDETKEIVERSGISAVMECLKKNNLVIITGLSGEGKTTVAIEVLKNLQAEHKGKEPLAPIVIEFPWQWDKVVNINERAIVFIDNMFGKSNLNQQKLAEWKSLIETDGSMERTVKKGNVLVIITSRSNIYYEAVKHIDKRNSLLSEKCMINLTDDIPLTDKEKKKLLMKNGFERLHWIEEILKAQPSTLFGFPLLCHLLSKDPKQTILERITISRNVFENIFEDIQRIMKVHEPEKYFALVYCFLQNDQTVDTTQLNSFAMTSDVREKMNQIAEACGITNDANKPVMLKIALECLSGFYVKKKHSVYSFYHESINEAVCVVFGKDYPQMVLKACNISFIIERVCLKATEGDENRLVIPERFYELLAERIAKTLQTSGKSKNKSMQMKYFCHLTSRNFIKELYSWFRKLQFCPCNLLSACSGSLNHISEFYGSDIKDLYVTTYGRWGYFCEVAQSTRNAIRQGNISTCELFLEKGGYLSSWYLLPALNSGNVDMVKLVFSRFAFLTEYDILSAVREACRLGNGDIVRYLLNEEPDYCCVKLAFRSDSTERNKLVIPHLKYPRDTLDSLLADVYSYGNSIDILKYLEQLGATITSRCLTKFLNNACRRYSSELKSKYHKQVLEHILSFQWTKEGIETSLMDSNDCEFPDEIVCYLCDRNYIFDETMLFKCYKEGWGNLAQYVSSHLTLTLCENAIDKLLHLACTKPIWKRFDQYGGINETLTTLKTLLDAGCTFTTTHLIHAADFGLLYIVEYVASQGKLDVESLTSAIQSAPQIEGVKGESIISTLFKNGGQLTKESLDNSIHSCHFECLKFHLENQHWDEDIMKPVEDQINSSFLQKGILPHKVIHFSCECFEFKKFKFKNETFCYFHEYIIKHFDYFLSCFDFSTLIKCCEKYGFKADERVIIIAVMLNKYEFVKSHARMLTKDQLHELPKYCVNPTVKIVKLMKDVGCQFSVQFLVDRVENDDQKIINFLLTENVFSSEILHKTIEECFGEGILPGHVNISRNQLVVEYVLRQAVMSNNHEIVKSHARMLSKNQLNKLPEHCVCPTVEMVKLMKDAGCEFSVQFLVDMVKYNYQKIINFLLTENVLEILHKTIEECFGEGILQGHVNISGNQLVVEYVLCQAVMRNNHEIVKSHVRMLSKNQLNKLPEYCVHPTVEMVKLMKDAGCEFSVQFLVDMVQYRNEQIIKFILNENVFSSKILHKTMEQCVRVWSVERNDRKKLVVEYLLCKSIDDQWIDLIEHLLQNITDQQLTKIHVFDHLKQYGETESAWRPMNTAMYKMFVEKGLPLSPWLLNLAVKRRCEDLVSYILDKGTFTPCDLSKSLTVACENGYDKLVRFLHSTGIEFEENCLENTKYNFDLVIFVLSNLKNPEKWYSKLLYEAICDGDLSGMLYFHSQGGVTNLDRFPYTEEMDRKCNGDDTHRYFEECVYYFNKIKTWSLTS